jgi:uncharacterized repeat protein (TIGR01451 family)
VVETLRDYGPNLRVEKDYRWNWKDQLHYEIDFYNLGTTWFEDLSITDTLPISTEFSGDWWHDFWRNVQFTNNNGQLVWTLEELEPGWSSRISFNADLDGNIIDVGGLCFTNTVKSPVSGDVYPDDNEDRVVAYSGPDIYIEKRYDGGELSTGDLVTFTIEFGNQNKWPWNSGNSTITDVLPSGMTFITATTPWDDNEPWLPDIQPGNLLVWDWDTVWADNWWEFNLVAQISETIGAAEVITNRVMIYSDDTNDVEVDYSNNVAEEPVTIGVKVYLPLVVRQ